MAKSAALLNPEPAVKIVAPDGHEFKVWANGHYEGFPEGAVIFNRVPLIIAAERIEAEDEASEVAYFNARCEQSDRD